MRTRTVLVAVALMAVGGIILYGPHIAVGIGLVDGGDGFDPDAARCAQTTVSLEIGSGRELLAVTNTGTWNVSGTLTVTGETGDILLERTDSYAAGGSDIIPFNATVDNATFVVDGCDRTFHAVER